jgi:hypothetical protein
MEAYLLKNQLTDITLIAGMTTLFTLKETSIIRCYCNPSVLETVANCIRQDILDAFCIYKALPFKDVMEYGNKVKVK